MGKGWWWWVEEKLRKGWRVETMVETVMLMIERWRVNL